MYETQEIKIACMVCCPLCDEKKCVGRFHCEDIKVFIENKRKAVQNEQ